MKYILILFYTVLFCYYAKQTKSFNYTNCAVILKQFSANVTDLNERFITYTNHSSCKNGYCAARITRSKRSFYTFDIKASNDILQYLISLNDQAQRFNQYINCTQNVVAMIFHDISYDAKVPGVQENLKEDNSQNGPNSPNVPNNQRQLTTTIERELQEIQKVEGYNMFQEVWLKQLLNQNTMSIYTVTHPKIKPWFRYLYNPTNPSSSRYRCDTCFLYLHLLRFNYKIRSLPIISEHGELKETKERNRAALRNHAKNPIHLKVLDWVEKYSNGEQVSPDDLLVSTAKYVRTVYTLVKMHGSVEDIIDLYWLQYANGVDLHKTFINKASVSRMIKTISQYFFKKLIDDIKYLNSPISIIIDTATDATNHNYLICYFSMMRDFEQQIVFYKLIKIRTDQDAIALTKLLKTNFIADGIEANIKTNLVSFVSDGCNVLQGNITSVSVLLNDWLGNPKKQLFKTHCFAHQLQLSLNKSYKKFIMVKSIESVLNDFSTFYFGFSNKRLAHLEELSETLQLKFYKFKNIHKIRFVASSRDMIRKFLLSFDAVYHELRTIIDDKLFTKDVQDRAEKFYLTLFNKNFMYSCYFLWDILELLSTASKQFQDSNAVFTDIDKIITTLITGLTQLEHNDGLHVKEFYDLLFILREDGMDENTQWSMQTYERFGIAHDKYNIVFEEREIEKFPKLSSFRKELILSIISELKAILPSDKLKLFSLFEPNSIGDVSSEKSDMIQEIFEMFGIEFKDDTFDKLLILLTEISTSSDYNIMKTKPFLKFWNYYLFRDGISWDDINAQFIKTLISLPLSSSSCETGFSVMQYIKDKRRSVMDAETLDAHLRIRQIGPKYAIQLDATNIAAEWVKDHNPPDILRQGPEKPPKKMRTDTMTTMDPMEEI